MSAREKAACLVGLALEAGFLLLALVRSGGVHDPQWGIVLFLVTSIVYLVGMAWMCRPGGGIRAGVSWEARGYWGKKFRWVVNV